MGRIGFVVCLVLGLLALPAVAQQIPEQIPEPLQGWQDWVLQEHPQHGCPFLSGRMPATDSRRCLWPRQLAIRVDEDGGRFRVEVRADAAVWLPLPGGDKHWPQQVSDHGEPVVVHDHDGTPMLRLAPGEHVLAGVWSWREMPARLAVPPTYGLVSVTLAGEPLRDIERAGGAVSLAESRSQAAAQANALSLEVYRRLEDGLPPTLATRLQLVVSGQAREVALGPVLPEGFVATQLSAPIPVRLDGQGRLHAQVRAGQWTIRFQARGTEPLAKLAMPRPASPWPQHEIWSYADAPELRRTRVQGQSVDAAQSGVPDEWRRLPAFRIDAEHGLLIEAGARAGQGGVEARISVERRLWLGFDGEAFTARDQLRGTLEHPRRLVVAPPWQLERARAGDQPLQVVKLGHGARAVEVRQHQLQLHAGLILPRDALGAMPVSGWQLPLQGLDVELRLPPGYRLLGAPGAGDSPDSWVASWSLLDLFLVALIALLCGRLLGWPMALVAIAYLVLAHGQAYAPYLTVLLTAGLALLARALPKGRLRLAVRLAAGAMLALAVLWAIPYATMQLRYAVYPQLEHGAPGTHVDDVAAVRFVAPPPNTKGVGRAARSDSSQLVRPESSTQVVSMMATVRPPARIKVSATAADEHKEQPLQLEPGLVQTGPGIPDWDAGNNYELHWSGPVMPDQSMRLIIAPSWLVRLLRVLAVVALAGLLARLLLSLKPSLPRRWKAAPAALVLLAGGLLAGLPGSATAAELPTPQMLEQLQQRLLQPPACAPACAVISAARLSIDGHQLTLLLQLQAEARVAVPMPDPGDGMTLKAVHVDGAPAALVGSDGTHWLRLGRGVHGARLTWTLGGDNVRLGFGKLAPKQVVVSAPGWSVSGLDNDRLRGDTLRLVRQPDETGASAAKAAAATSQAFAPYVRLTRRFLIGSDWRVVNTVERIAPATSGFSVKLPLLPGAHPLDEAVRVDEGHITLSFKAGQQSRRWTSRIEPFQRLELTAPPLAQRSVRWQLRAGPAWHIDAKGVPPQPAEGLWQWAPLPGEILQLHVTRPAAAPGPSVAVDHALVSVHPGQRATDLTLALSIRSTHGGEQVIKLPPGTQVLKARRDNQRLALSVHDGRMSLPLRPGSHQYTMTLRRPQDIGMLARTPTVDVQAPVANIDLRLGLPDDRWLLWTWGPQNGPAVLYWSQLLVLLIVAWLLARFAPTPLRLWHWLLLGLGFSTFAWSAFALVAVWLICLGLRERMPDGAGWPRLGFNLMQVALAVLTVVALLVLIGAVPRGLLGQPNMHLAGIGPGAGNLHWMLDQSHGQLPRAGVLSLPLWCYKLAILAWALWLANALVGWLRWGFQAWSKGDYWRRRTRVDSPDEPPPSSPQRSG